jgi:O-acetyl-ADP-ribose deacetylase (regulator of RNase III)
MVRFTKGDLLKAGESYIAQGVAEGNQEGLGTGLAHKISAKWPDVQKAFKRHARTGRFTGGSIWVSNPTADRPGFVYLATQPDMYHATIPYLRRALRELVKWTEAKQVPSVALPKIGSGLGKLSWDAEVKPLVLELLQVATCEFVVYEDFTLEDERGGSQT